MKPIILIKTQDWSDAIFCIQQIQASTLGYAEKIFPPKKRKSVPNKRERNNK